MFEEENEVLLSPDQQRLLLSLPADFSLQDPEEKEGMRRIIYSSLTPPHIQIIKPLLLQDSKGLVCREEDRGVFLVIFLIFHYLAHAGNIIM